MKIIFLKLALSWLFCFGITLVYSQINTSQNQAFVKSKAKLIIEDSDYVLKPQLFNESKDQKIQIHKVLTFGIGDGCTSIKDCRFYLQKRIRDFYVYIEPDISLSQEIYSKDAFDFKDYSTNDSINIKIGLKNYYPFEIGDYRIMVEIDYYLDKIKYTIGSEWTNFSVNHIPKNSIYNN